MKKNKVASNCKYYDKHPLDFEHDLVCKLKLRICKPNTCIQYVDKRKPKECEKCGKKYSYDTHGLKYKNLAENISYDWLCVSCYYKLAVKKRFD